MIQRQQTLWLLLATAAGILSFMFPFAVGDKMEKDLLNHYILDAGSQFFLLILSGASLLLSTFIIFLYRNRKQQVQLCWLGLVISIGLLALYIVELKKMAHYTLALSAVFPPLIIIGYFMAMRGIRKDEKLVKSLDKLR